ncbi:unnamed protein product [Brassica oleracea]
MKTFPGNNRETNDYKTCLHRTRKETRHFLFGDYITGVELSRLRLTYSKDDDFDTRS